MYRPRPAVDRPGALAGQRVAQHLERQKRALAPGRGDVDPEQVEHPVGVERGGLVDVHPDQLLGGDRRRGLRDRAAVAVEAQVLDPPVGDADLDTELIAAERVVLVGVEVVGLELAEVPRSLVVLEDEIAVEVVHQANTLCAPRTARRARRRRRGRCRGRSSRALSPDAELAPSAAARSGGSRGRRRSRGRAARRRRAGGCRRR
jgi:hypothetical protein